MQSGDNLLQTGLLAMQGQEMQLITHYCEGAILPTGEFVAAENWEFKQEDPSPKRTFEILADAVVCLAADAANLSWPAPELAVRFHHRLVAIHPFPNGNGRHARLCADLIVRALGAQPLSWGGRLTDENQARDIYIAALQHADRESDYGPLLTFAQS